MVNLVKNPSFETTGTAFGNGHQWMVLGAANTQVPYWTSVPPLYGEVQDGFPAFGAGSRYAVMGANSGFDRRLFGRLSATAGGGATYLLSAEVQTPLPNYSLPKFTLRLRRINGTESSAHVQLTVQQTSTWMLISGTVVANTNYDYVSLRMEPVGNPILGALLLVDDVHVCQVTAGTGTGHGTGHGNGWFSDHGTLVLVLVLVGVILGGLGVGWRRYRRNVMATNNGAPSIGVADFDNDGNVDT